MKHYKILAMASMENEKKAEELLDNDSFKYMGTVLLDSKGVGKVMNTSVDALVIVTDVLTSEDTKLLERIYMSKKNLVMILLTGTRDIEILTEAMSCGIGKVLTTDMEQSQIQEEIISEIAKNRSRGTDAGEQKYDSKILSVFGTKGGAGKTTVSVNMAVALQKKGKKVLLIDLDLQFGDVGVFMDIPVYDTISDLVAENDYSLATVNSYLYTHSSGVRVLLAPQSPEFAELVKPTHVNAIIDAVKDSYDYIIFDLGPTLDDCVLQALELSDTVYFIITPEISTLKNAKNCMNVLNTLELSKKVKFILNKDGDSYVKKKDVESTLDEDIELVISSDPKTTVGKEIIRFVNRDEI